MEGKWKGSGREVEGKWKGSGRKVEGKWKESGRKVEGKWQGSGREVELKWKGSGREVAPNDIAYKRWSCHSGLKLLCKLCRTSPPDLPFFGMPAMRTRWMAGAVAHKSG